MPKNAPKRNGFRQLEQMLTMAVLADFMLFLLFLIVSGFGILWLKVITALLTIALSGLGTGFLVLIGEHKRIRSRWIITAFAGILICTLVSLIANYPSPMPV